MSKVGIALVGAGAIGRKHADALARSERAFLAAVVDPAPDAREIPTRYGAVHCGSVDALPSNVQGVILATPTQLHLEQALSCIARKLPVLVEKPVAATVDEAISLDKAAIQAGVPVLVGHHRRHNPRIAAARAAIVGGRIGQLISAEVSVLLCKPDDYFLPAWRRQRGAGPILTNLIHEVDTLRHLLGEVTDVRALASNATRGLAVEDSAAVLLRFSCGALATVSVSDATAAPWSWELTAAENADYPVTGEAFLRISGTAGALELPTLKLWRQEGSRSWFSPMTCDRLSVEYADPLARQIIHFVEVIRGEAAPLVPVSDAARSLAVVENVAHAANCLHSERIAS